MIVSVEGRVPLKKVPKVGSKVVVIDKGSAGLEVGTVAKVIYSDFNDVLCWATTNGEDRWCYMFQRLASGSGIKIPKDDPLYKVGKK